MNLSDASSIASIATPFTSLLIETFLKPKLDSLRKSAKKNNQIVDHSIENKFKNYLNNIYKYHLTLSTVAFKRRTILLKDVYVPLTISNENNSHKIKIAEINSGTFPSNKILIIDSAGMGKSTISKRLLLSCIELNFGIPVLIELRRLSSTNDIIGEIINQLTPINQEVDRQLVLDLIERGDFIFFFDGYDEIEPNIKTYITNLINDFVKKADKNKFLMTSRPEGATLSFGNFEKFKIDALTENESFELIKRYDNTKEVAHLLIKKILEPQTYYHISEYLTSPLLVSLLYAAFEYKQKIPFEKHNFYRQVFDSLYESHDLSKGDSYERKKHTNLTIDQFHKILRIIAFNCLQERNKIEFKRDEFDKLLDKSIADYYGLKCTVADLKKDLLISVPIFKEDGIYYRWSHKSLQEYFSAQYIYSDSKERQKTLLEYIAFHPKNEIYINVIDLYRSIDPEFFDDVIVYKILKEYFDFSSNLFNYIDDGSARKKRIDYMFCLNLTIGKFKLDNHILRGNFFDSIRSNFEESIIVGITMVPIDEEKIDYLKIPRIPKNTNAILKLLRLKNYDFVKDFEILRSYNNIEVQINEFEFEKVYIIDESPQNILNSEKYFNKINQLLNVFLAIDLHYIDNELGQKFLDKISKKLKEKEEGRNYQF